MTRYAVFYCHDGRTILDTIVRCETIAEARALFRKRYGDGVMMLNVRVARFNEGGFSW